MSLPTIEKILSNFAVLPDWTDRYRYIIDLGRKLPPMPEDLKTEDNLVPGCISKVWLTINKEEDIITFYADSDAHITKGLIAILVSIYSGKTQDEMAAIDLQDIFKQLDLDNHLSFNRRNGFSSMVQKIKELSNESN